MPRQNRVTPFGEIVAIPERGTMMGNRGRLHDDEGSIRTPWQVKRWLLCVLEFRGRKRVVMAPDRYTELFFLDEATGLAAGHRPCAECRHGRFVAFRDAWAAGNPSKVGAGGATADLMDAQLHAERLGPNRTKRLFRADVRDLPDGVFVSSERDGATACLLWQGDLLIWSPGGYKRVQKPPRSGKVLVVTPRSTAAAIRAGYVPDVHPTARLD
jgi:hypothetical protein